MTNASLPHPAAITLYASIGPMLGRYTLGPDGGPLTLEDTVELPENVQYAWPHAAGRHLYVASSNGVANNGPRGDSHHLSAYHIDPGTGALTPAGASVRLPHRPIHITTDAPSKHVLVAFNNPAAIRIYRIQDDATLGPEVAQTQVPDPGIFPHQLRVTSDGRRVIAVARGNEATPDRAEDPGRLTVFDLAAGVLRDPVVVAPEGGFGFGPRDVDFHPGQPWLYVSLERQNQIAMLDWSDRTAPPQLRHRRNTLAHPERRLGRQIVGAVHVHPGGHVAYVANRASAVVKEGDREIFAGGENSIAVFALDAANGEPSLLQCIDTRGIHPRTFGIDPSGRLLVVAHITGLTVRTGGQLSDVPTGISVFRIAPDGTLSWAATHDIETGGRLLWWMGMLGRHAGR